MAKIEQEAIKTEAQAMVTAVVARGRTVTCAHPTEKVLVSRNDFEGKYVSMHVPRLIDHGPGERVSLSKSDFEDLLALGFILDSNDTAAIAALSAPGTPESELSRSHRSPI